LATGYFELWKRRFTTVCGFADGALELADVDPTEKQIIESVEKPGQSSHLKQLAEPGKRG
jgi:hypothetical protein